jgi:hypothetical protein
MDPLARTQKHNRAFNQSQQVEEHTTPNKARFGVVDTRGFERAMTMPISQEELDTPNLGMTRKGGSETIDSGFFSLFGGFGDETPDESEDGRLPTLYKREFCGPIILDLDKGCELLKKPGTLEPEVGEED